jgi:hypothetical protein
MPVTIGGSGTLSGSRVTASNAVLGAVNTLVDGATITADFTIGNNFIVTLGGNRTLGAPTSAVAGQGGVITIQQDSTGNRTLAFNSVWKFPNGIVPALTTTANATDVLVYSVDTASRITCQLLSDVK